MKSITRRHNKPKTQTITAGKARWMPNDNTRAQTFADRRAVANKRACRVRVSFD